MNASEKCFSHSGIDIPSKGSSASSMVIGYWLAGWLAFGQLSSCEKVLVMSCETKMEVRQLSCYK
jgi:hypothetical protein